MRFRKTYADRRIVGISFLHQSQGERKKYENKNIVIPHRAGLGIALNPQLSTAHAQGTAFTYQGRLNFNGNPAAGNFDVRFAVFDTNTNGNQFGFTLTNSATAVTNGLFAVTLDFGAGIFTGPSRWLEISARTNGNGAFATLTPRQALTPTPYAMFANTASNVSGTVSAAQIGGGTLLNSVLPTSPSFSGTVSANQISGNGGNVTNVNAAALNGKAATNFWQTGGNAGTSPTNGNFLGTTDNQPLVLKVNGQQVARYEPTTTTPNVIGGFSNNSVQSGLVGATIGGGGAAYGNQPNAISGNGSYGTVAGGYQNTVMNFGSAILGGSVNSVGGQYSMIGGGEYNTEQGDFSAIGGGQNNTAAVGTQFTTIGGGSGNQIGHGSYGTIGGGVFNTVSGAGGTVPGGNGNLALGINSFAAGTYSQATHDGSFVLADNNYVNFYSTTVNQFSARFSGGVRWVTSGAGMTLDGLPVLVSSGLGNGAGLTNVNAATLNGQAAVNFWQLGGNNTSASQFIGSTNNQPLVLKANGRQVVRYEPTTDTANVIGGSAGNTVQSGLLGATIGGGGTTNGNQPNVINNNGSYGTIVGGFRNTVTNYGGAVLGGAANFNGGAFAAIGGGEFNTDQGDFSTLGGGQNNTIQSGASYATIAGGNYGVIYATSDYGAVGGGQKNNIFNGPHGVIGGGSNNIVQAVGAVVGGGLNNQAGLFTGLGAAAVVAGGENNYANGQDSVISGGKGNTVAGNYATVSGGHNNSASGDYSFAAGRQANAQHDGTFVWADSQNANFASSSTNQFLIRANNGVGINTNNPAGALHIVNLAPGYTGSYGQTAPAALVLDYQNPNLYGDEIQFWKSGREFGSILSRPGEMDFSCDSQGTGTQMYMDTNHVEIARDLTVNGSINSSSDRNVKTNFVAIHPTEVLAKVIGLNIQTWNYTNAPASIRHLGPMAQDFYAAFGIGTDERHIATVDEGGVALAAIQGLNQKLEAENAELKARLEKIERLLAHHN